MYMQINDKYQILCDDKEASNYSLVDMDTNEKLLFATKKVSLQGVNNALNQYNEKLISTKEQVKSLQGCIKMFIKNINELQNANYFIYGYVPVNAIHSKLDKLIDYANILMKQSN